MPRVIAYGCDDATTQFHPLQIEGYRTLRVAGGVTFRLIDAGKSMF